MIKDPKQEVDEELRIHLEQRTRDYIARGMSPEAAREAAAQRFGDTARVSEACTAVVLAGPVSPARWGPPRRPRHLALWPAPDPGYRGDPHGR